MATFPTDPAVRVESFLSIAKGDGCNVSHLSLGSHTGTHLDAPAHFVAGGITVDRLPVDLLVGPVRVFAIDVPERIDRAELAGLALRGLHRVLFKTRNSALWATGRFEEAFVYLTGAAAEHLVACGVRLVGLDYLSVEGFRVTGGPAHKALLQAGVVILEGLDLSAIAAGDYELICLPLKLAGGDGAPARVVLIER
jgi:arylformamidase